MVENIWLVNMQNFANITEYLQFMNRMFMLFITKTQSEFYDVFCKCTTEQSWLSIFSTMMHSSNNGGCRYMFKRTFEHV